jgi:hypothetical protein
VDAWDSKLNSTGYTHYTNTGASRYDRIYMSPTVNARKLHTTTLAAAFTDHNAVQVKTSRETITPQPRKQLLEIERQSLNYGRPERSISTTMDEMETQANVVRHYRTMVEYMRKTRDTIFQNNRQRTSARQKNNK